MKKLFVILMITVLLLSTLSIVTSAEGDYVELEMSEKFPEIFVNADPWEFEWSIDRAGAYQNSVSEGDVYYNYIYLKDYDLSNQPVELSYNTVEFEILEAGTYDFLIEVMAYSTKIPRTGLVQIDDGEKYYISSVHGERHLVTEYYEGITVFLDEGWHKITVYLGDDFDDENVKSLFFDNFSFVMIKDANGNIVDPTETRKETEAPTESNTEKPTEDVTENTTESPESEKETAKKTEDTATADESGKSGCKSAFSGGVAAVILITAAFGMMFVKKEN